MPLQVVTKSAHGFNREAQPAAPAPLGKPAPAPVVPPAAAPVVNVSPLLANQSKHSLDGIRLSIAGAGHLIDFSVTNKSDATRYLMLFDGEAKPNEGDRPRRVWTITTLATFDGIWPAGRPFNSGLTLILSSTQAYLTAATAADGILEATYRV